MKIAIKIHLQIIHPTIRHILQYTKNMFASSSDEYMLKVINNTNKPTQQCNNFKMIDPTIIPKTIIF